MSVFLSLFFHLNHELQAEHHNKDMENLRHSAANESEDTHDVFNFPHRNDWRLWTSRAQTTGRSTREPSAEESGPVRADESGTNSLMKDVVQEAEELRHVPAPVLPSEAEVEAHNVSLLPFRSWCSACVRGRGLSLGHRVLTLRARKK